MTQLLGGGVIEEMPDKRHVLLDVAVHHELQCVRDVVGVHIEGDRRSQYRLRKTRLFQKGAVGLDKRDQMCPG